MTLSRRDALGRLSAFTAAGLLGLLPRRLGALDPKPFTHPDPRPGVTADKVLPAERLASARRAVRDAYDGARAYPELFDGVYCACDCSKVMGHRSLLSCFESEQPMGCIACREEGELVGKLARDGKSLADIRSAVDKEFG